MMRDELALEEARMRADLVIKWVLSPSTSCEVFLGLSRAMTIEYIVTSLCVASLAFATVQAFAASPNGPGACGIKEVIRQRKRSGFGTTAPATETLCIGLNIRRCQMAVGREAPTGTLMRLYYSSAVPRQGSDRDRLCCEYNGSRR